MVEYLGWRNVFATTNIIKRVCTRNSTYILDVSPRLDSQKWYDSVKWFEHLNLLIGLPWWRSGWESACQCRGHRFEPWSGKIPHAAEQLGPWATTTEPACLEPVLRNKRGRDRGPRTAMKSGPRSPQLEKALTQKWRPNTAKNKINKFIKKKTPRGWSNRLDFLMGVVAKLHYKSTWG